MRHKNLLTTTIAIAGLLVFATPAAAQGPWEREAIVGQGLDGDPVSEDGAAVLRTANGINVKVSMPTPEPDTYPQGPTASGEPGHPETFSLWVFIFFNPEKCHNGCDGSDLSDSDVIAGAFNGGGHVVGGTHLTMAGRINHQTPTFGPTEANTLGEALDEGFDLADAEIHLAVAPHGALDPSLLPESITTPVGGPDEWWLAIFE